MASCGTIQHLWSTIGPPAAACRRLGPRSPPSQAFNVTCQASKHGRKQRDAQPRDKGERQQAAAPAGGGRAAAEAAERPSTSAAANDDWVQFAADPPGHRAGFVAIIGRPNAGKSTLMNAILGQQLSIVTERAQTTRKRILGILSEPDYQVVFLDTPGIILDKRNRLEEKMMASVQESVKDADALLAIVDVSNNPEEALRMIQPGEDWKGPPMAVILNKVDTLDPEQLAELTSWFEEHCRAECVIPASALRGDNVDQVLQWVTSKLPESPSLYPKDVVADQPERFFVGEFIRKHVFLQYRQEVPYCVAVEVVDYKERPGAKDYVSAHIIVEKEGLRGILLGRQGSAIKALATAARLDIEEFLQRPVYLELSVKVVEGWRKDDKALERLGY